VYQSNRGGEQFTMATIMVVDDDPDFVDIVSLILEQQYEISTAANGKQALERMREQKPDLVLLDVMMSYVLDGIDVAEAMCLDPELKDVPVIMCSSLPASQCSAYSERFPTDSHVAVDDWMSKPVKPDELLQKVAALLKET
jgi:CheY-like chemotaxis protein